MFDFLKGYKSIIGVVGAVAAFVGLLCNQLVDGFQVADIEPILTGFSAMMLAWGLTGKAIEIQNSIKK
jgi:hypothetical protein